MKHVVGLADMKISGSQHDTIVTHALGSCLGVAVYDPIARVGGIAHVMLPLSTADPEKAKENPLMFVDTGVVRLFIECYELGALKQRMIVKAAGGASSGSNREEDFFQIGRRNFTVLRKLLWKNGVILHGSDVGGNEYRTMILEIASGEVVLKSKEKIKRL